MQINPVLYRRPGGVDALNQELIDKQAAQDAATREATAARQAQIRDEEMAAARHRTTLSGLDQQYASNQQGGSGSGVGTRTVSSGAVNDPQRDLLLAKIRGQINDPIKFSATSSSVDFDEAGADRARNLAFARAKERAGQTALSALKSIRGATASRGIGTGSTLEGEQVAGAISGAAGGLGDVITAQAGTEAEQGQRQAELQYQGDITQRGQDLQAQIAEANARQQLLSLYGAQLY